VLPFGWSNINQGAPPSLQLARIFGASFSLNTTSTFHSEAAHLSFLTLVLFNTGQFLKKLGEDALPHVGAPLRKLKGTSFGGRLEITGVATTTSLEPPFVRGVCFSQKTRNQNNKEEWNAGASFRRNKGTKGGTKARSGEKAAHFASQEVAKVAQKEGIAREVLRERRLKVSRKAQYVSTDQEVARRAQLGGRERDFSKRHPSGK